MLKYLTGIYLGWSLGANDAANVFGTAVGTKMVKFWTAAILSSFFVILGALIEGKSGIETLSKLSTYTEKSAIISSFSAAVTITIMTILKLPASVSQAVIGSIIGLGAFKEQIQFGSLQTVLICWILTPIGAMFFSILLYYILAPFMNKISGSIIYSDFIIKIGLIIVGCYGSYALGANNVANVTGVFVGAGILNPFTAALIGGLSIGLGILTFSKGVMKTVGKNIVRLNAYSALIVVLSEAVTVHIFAMIGVPVSTSQAVVGGVLGVGLIKRVEAIKFKTVLGIFSGWFFTPVISMILSMFIYLILHLKFVH